MPPFNQLLLPSSQSVIPLNASTHRMTHRDSTTSSSISSISFTAAIDISSALQPASQSHRSLPARLFSTRSTLQSRSNIPSQATPSRIFNARAQPAISLGIDPVFATRKRLALPTQQPESPKRRRPPPLSPLSESSRTQGGQSRRSRLRQRAAHPKSFALPSDQPSMSLFTSHVDYLEARLSVEFDGAAQIDMVGGPNTG